MLGWHVYENKMTLSYLMSVTDQSCYEISFVTEKDIMAFLQWSDISSFEFNREQGLFSCSLLTTRTSER